MTLMSYVPKKSKAVILLSTLHNDASIDEDIGNQRKPQILTFYNQTKGGVDTNDKLCAAYNMGRRTRRWPVVLFFHLVNVTAINVRVICVANSGRAIVRSAFLKELANELVRPLKMIRVQDTHIPRQIRKRLREDLDFPEEQFPDQPAGKRQRCSFCPRARNRSTQQICVKCHKNACGEHLRNICVYCFAN